MPSYRTPPHHTGKVPGTHASAARTASFSSRQLLFRLGFEALPTCVPLGCSPEFPTASETGAVGSPSRLSESPFSVQRLPIEHFFYSPRSRLAKRTNRSEGESDVSESALSPQIRGVALPRMQMSYFSRGREARFLPGFIGSCTQGDWTNPNRSRVCFAAHVCAARKRLVLSARDLDTNARTLFKVVR